MSGLPWDGENSFNYELKAAQYFTIPSFIA